VEVWSARDHFVSLMTRVVKSSSFLLRDFSFSLGSRNSLREKDRESFSTLKERSKVLSKSSASLSGLQHLDGKIQPLASSSKSPALSLSSNGLFIGIIGCNNPPKNQQIDLVNLI